MVNETIIQKFLHDLGTLTCSEDEVIKYFRGLGVDPREYIDALHAMPSIHFVNDKIWQD